MSRLIRFFSMAQKVKGVARNRVVPRIKSVGSLSLNPIPQSNSQIQPNRFNRLGGYNLMFGLMVGGGLLYVVKVIAEQWEKQKHQITIKNPDDLKNIHERMVQAWVHPDTETKKLVGAINEVVTTQNEKVFAVYLEKLFDQEVNDEYLDLLISTCAAQGKVSLLRILQEEFHLDDLIKKNPTARRSINHMAANQIEQLSAQFINRLGSIQGDGAHLQLSYKKIQDEESAIEKANIDSPLVTGLDSIGDVRLVFSFLREQEKARAPVRDLYNSLVILDVLANGEESFKRYLETLKALYEQQQKPITSIFLLYGTHFTCGEIELTKTVNGEYEVQMFYMDSLGRGKHGEHPEPRLIRDCEQIFPTRVEYYVSEIKNQYAPLGCSAFALMHVYDLIHLNQTLSVHAKAGLRPYHDLFDYINHHITDIKVATYKNFQTKGDVFYSYQTVLPPLAFSRGKQSMTRDGVDVNNPKDKRLVVGYMGLPQEISQSSLERQKELSQVVNHATPMTMAAWLGYYVRSSDDLNSRSSDDLNRNTSNKSRNETTKLLVGQWGLELAPWLTLQKASDIKEFTQAFTVHEFAKKNNITIEDVPMDTNRPAGP